MNLWLLFTDELRGFYKSRIMIVLWVGLPILVAVLHLAQPDSDEISFTALSGLLVASLGGTLGAAMLAVSLINEKAQRIYDLFLIRPVARRDILLSKFLAVFGCITLAAVIAHFVGMGLDVLTLGAVPAHASGAAVKSWFVTLAGLGVSCAAGIAIGVVTQSVLAGVILVIYVGNQISGLPLLPVLLGMEGNPELLAAGLGVVLTVALLVASIAIFNRKQF